MTTAWDTIRLGETITSLDSVVGLKRNNVVFYSLPSFVTITDSQKVTLNLILTTGYTIRSEAFDKHHRKADRSAGHQTDDSIAYSIKPTFSFCSLLPASRFSLLVTYYLSYA